MPHTLFCHSSAELSTAVTLNLGVEVGTDSAVPICNKNLCALFHRCCCSCSSCYIVFWSMRASSDKDTSVYTWHRRQQRRDPSRSDETFTFLPPIQ